LFEVSVGATNTASIKKYRAIALGIGFFMFLKDLIMETNAMSWVNTLRTKALKKQVPAHSAPALIRILIKYGDDACTLISVIVGQRMVVVTILGVGLVWVLVRGWQLTLPLQPCLCLQALWPCIPHWLLSISPGINACERMS
jgi:ATP-binding cassette subfamily B (MDR/TAP) protein 1